MDDDLDMLTVPQLCVLLKVSRYWVYQQVAAGRLPAVRIGPRRWRFRRCEVERYVREHAS
jgi:excisionase family DNA binding protein